jgi:hypothetical protein
MTMQHLDTVIAFAAVMLGLSLLIVVGTQAVVSFLGLRGTNLQRSLADLFEKTSADRDARRYSREISRRVLSHPLVSDSVFSRFGIRADELPFIPAEAAGKLQWAASAIPLRPWLFGALGGFFAWPLALVAIKYLSFLDACKYSDLIASYVPVLNFCEHPWRSGAIAGAVFVGLLHRWRLATSIHAEELASTLEKLSEPQQGTLPDPAQRAMLVIAGEAQNDMRPKAKPVSSHLENTVNDTLDFGDGGIALAVEKAVAQTAAVSETRPIGLKASFDQMMVRASQRFTVQARVITVLLSLVFVFGAHLDAIRLFQTLSSDGQLRAALAGSADAMIRQAEQTPRTKEGARTVVPDVYRKAMSFVLQPVQATTEQKPKSRPAPRKVVPPPSSAQPQTGGAVTPSDAQDSAASPIAQAAPESPAKNEEAKDASRPKRKTLAKESEKPAAPVSLEDKVTTEAKARAAKALEARPGFASREDAVSWLRVTLDEDPALENLASVYEQELNTELVSDADKLIDHSASLKRELARSESQFLPEKWQLRIPAKHELPGLLIAVAFLSLAAPFSYNLLKGLASLRPARLPQRS